MLDRSSRLVALAAVIVGAAASTMAAVPNWGGIWEVDGLRIGASGAIEMSPQEIVAEFGAQPPYTARGRREFQDFLQKFLANADHHAEKLCEFGFPDLMLESPLMFEVLSTPQETAMIFSGREVRHIYTDGRKHPPEDELFATPWGNSIGHWDGDTLVIDTIAAGDTYFLGQRLQSPRAAIAIFAASDFAEVIALLSQQAHYTERLRLLDRNHLEDQLTIEDPSQFSRPWTITHRYHHVPGVKWMIHEDCEGNDRNPVVNGQFTLH
jgi:hypothetical protein